MQTLWPSICTPSCMPNRMHPHVRRNACTFINSIIHKYQKLETTPWQNGHVNCDEYRRGRPRRNEGEVKEEVVGASSDLENYFPIVWVAHEKTTKNKQMKALQSQWCGKQGLVSRGRTTSVDRLSGMSSDRKRAQPGTGISEASTESCRLHR